MGLFSRKKETRELQYFCPNASGALSYFPFVNNFSPIQLSAVYRAIELISNSVATLPVKVRDNRIVGNEAIEHDLNYVFSDRNHNTLITKFTLMKLLVQSVLMRGNGFALIEREKGKITSLRYLETTNVNIVYDKVKNTLYYDVPMLNRRVNKEDMIHFKMFSYDGINGLSVLQNASRTLAIAASAENTAKSYFENGGKLDGVLTVNGPVNRQQREDIRAAWNETYTAGGNGIAILQGNMTYQPIQSSAKDAQMLESRIYNVQDIARFFGINPVLLGELSKTSFNDFEAIQLDFLVHCLQAYVTMIEAEFNRKLLSDNELHFSVYLDTNEILRTDKAGQSSYYTSLISSGVLSINEVRKDLGYGDIEEGDKHMVAYTDIQQNTLETNKDNENIEQ